MEARFYTRRAGITGFEAPAGADARLEKSRLLIIGAKADILIDNLFAEMRIKNNGRFGYYLTNDLERI